MALVSEALATARAMLNDAGDTLWHDSVLLPFAKEAHRELQVRLELVGVPVINAVSAIISVPAFTTDLSVISGYPTDLVKPEWMKERAPGQTDRDFLPMKEVDFIPNQQQDISLIYWAWIGERIRLLGSTQNREVLLRYWRSLSSIVDQTSSIGFLYGENWIGPRTAAQAANSVGNTTLYESAMQEALGKLDEVIRMNVKGTQNLPARRRAYHRGSKSRALRDF